MKRSLVVVFAVLSVIAARSATSAEPYGTIHRVDPRFDKLVPPGAQIEKLGGSCEWAEGPVWVEDGGYLLFSDVRTNRVMKWKDGEGLTEWMKPSGYTGLGRASGSNGLAVDPQGLVVFCEHGDRRISKLLKDGGKQTLVDSFEGKRLNSPNDAVFKSNGDLYFTDPPYGFPRQMNDTRRELDFCGVYRLSKDGKLTLLSKDLSRPNGIGFSPDEKTLYVANSGTPLAWYSFDVKADGTLGAAKLFIDVAQAAWPRNGTGGSPDGLKVDSEGNLWSSAPGGVRVFSADGTLLGTIQTPETCANLCFGGPDGKTVFLTATTSLARLKTNARGIVFSP